MQYLKVVLTAERLVYMSMRFKCITCLTSANGKRQEYQYEKQFFQALSLCLVEPGEKRKEKSKKKKQEMINDGWNGEENLFLMYV